MMETAAIERARQAAAQLATAQTAATTARSKAAELKSEDRRNQAERERLRAEKEADDALRLLDGEDAVPRKPRRDGRLAKLDAEAAAHAAALRLQERRVAEAEAAASAPHLTFVREVLELISGQQSEATAAARAILANLAPVLANLLAADQIRAATIGDRFPMPPGACPPFRGLTVIKNFAAAIPDRLRPPELTERQLLDAAHAISSAVISQIREA
jgi:hypothetical protein